MSTEELIKVNSESNSSSLDNKTSADIYYINPNSESDITKTIDENISYSSNSMISPKKQKVIKMYSDDIPDFKIRNDYEKELISKSYDLIIDSLDQDLDQIERSNIFDDWKDSLLFLSSDIYSFNSNHRKILGAIIAATRDKDISDFSPDDLNILKDSTYLLKQFRISRLDSKRIISKLININADIIIPLNTSDISEDYESFLENYINDILDRSK
jgi:hypothetical protein